MKFQAPSTKSQTPKGSLRDPTGQASTKHQAQNPKRVWNLGFGDLDLFGVWNLGFGISARPARGMALLLVVLVLAGLLSISLGIFGAVFGEFRISGETADSFRALYAADEAIEKMRYDDLAADSVPGCSGVGPCSYGPVTLPASPSGACATVRLTRISGGRTEVIATGEYRCGGAELAVKRSFKVTYRKVLPNCDTAFKSDQFYVCYFDGISAPLTASPVLNQFTQTTVPSPVGSWSGFDNNWGGGIVDTTSKSDQVSGVWRGRINFQAGTYVFHTVSSDGVELNISGFGNVISNWTDHGPTQNDSAAINLPAGPRDVQLRWYENSGVARIRLWWDRN